MDASCGGEAVSLSAAPTHPANEITSRNDKKQKSSLYQSLLRCYTDSPHRIEISRKIFTIGMKTDLERDSAKNEVNWDEEIVSFYISFCVL